MTTADGASAATPPARRARLARQVLVSNLVSGALWLLLPAAFGAWPLSVVGAVYVAVASAFLAVVYAQEALTIRQEVVTWVVPWVGAVALWSTVLGTVESDDTANHYLAGLAFGLLLGTLSYLGWQVLALAIRQVLARRSTTSSSPTNDSGTASR